MSTNPLTNQSYINKDFQTIYPELLDLVKTLTHKWDPTISNESDPGVLLIKLNAIIADKNNYNIDKNVLECFPDTVTQTQNAHKLFEQLGYNMSWYRAAKGEITLSWNSDKLEYDGFEGTPSLKVPQFTMVCDKDKELVYTIPEGFSLPIDGKSVTVTALQGVIRDYQVGNATLIKPSMLDSHNRLHLPIFNVAQNGIFISDANKNRNTNEYEFIWRNPETSTLDGWTQVDNLAIQALNTKCYKFGVDHTTGGCYIEFPSDIVNLMQDGLFIKYLQTDGATGNIAPKRIEGFYTDVEIVINENKVNITTDTKVTNYSSINNGKDPETIDDAYNNYKKVVGTFDTLVTLRDYLNFIVNEEFEVVSNGVIADRSNDIQSSYSVVSTFEGTTTFNKIVENATVTHTVKFEGEQIGTYDEQVPEMSAFDLKTYLLEYSPWPKFSVEGEYDSQKTKFKEAYDKSFNLQLCDDVGGHKLDTPEKIKTYYEDAKRIEHDFIPKKSSTLDNIRPLFFKNKFKLNLTIIPNNMVSETQAAEIEKNVYDAVLKQLSAGYISFGDELSFEKVYDICSTADNRIKAIALDSIEYTPYAVVYFDTKPTPGAYVLKNEKGEDKDKNGRPLELKAGLNEIPISQIVVCNPDSISNPGGSSNQSVKSLNDIIALDICAKNILCGTTPLYHKSNDFTYDIAQNQTKTITNVARMTTDWTAMFNNINGSDWVQMSNLADRTKSATKVLDNESIVLYAPYLKDVMTYSQSMKYFYYTTDRYTGTDTDFIPANTDYILEPGQVLFIFWKDEDSKDAPYQYVKYSEGTILRAGLNLIKSTIDRYESIKSSLNTRGYGGEGQVLGALNDDLFDISDTILSTTKTITIKKVNAVSLTDAHNYCYWITNDIRYVEGQDEPRYNITFDYVAPEVNRVSETYSGGLMYVSNFDVSSSQFVDTSASGSTDDTTIKGYTLTGDEKIWILRPQPIEVTHMAEPINSYVPSSETFKAVNYHLVKLLTAEATIYCNGDIIRADESILNDEAFKDGGLSSTNPVLKWGELKTDVTRPEERRAFTEVKMGTYMVGSTTHPLIAKLDTDYAGRDYILKSLDDSGNNWKLTNDVTGLSWDIIRSGGNFQFTDEGKTYTLLTVGPSGYTDYKLGDYFAFSMGPAEMDSGVKYYSVTTRIAKDYTFPDHNIAATTLTGSCTHLILSSGYRIDVLDLEAKVDTTISRYEYVLREGEEFIYTDENKKGLYIHHSGTKVMLDCVTSSVTDSDSNAPKQTLTFEVPVFDTLEQHSEEDSEKYKNFWYDFTCTCTLDDKDEVDTFTDGTIVSVMENQMITLGSGSDIRVSQIPYEVTKRNKDSGKLETVSMYDENYCNLRITSGGVAVAKKTDQLPTDGDFKKRPNILSHYNIQYKDEDSQSWTDLTPASHPSIGWNAYTRLDIKSGATNPQLLSTKHKDTILCFTKEMMEMMNEGEVTGESITFEDASGNMMDSYFQTSSSVSMFGGEYADVTGVNIDNETVYLSVLAYTKDEDFIGTKTGYTISQSDDKYVIEIGATDTTSDINITIPCQSYNSESGTENKVTLIMPIEVSGLTDGVDLLSLRYGSGTGSGESDEIPLGHITDNIATQGEKSYYYALTNPNGIQIKYEGTSGVVLTFRPLLNYYYSKAEDDDKNIIKETLEEVVMGWDKRKIFDYSYQPERDTVINNPLSPKEYFNKSHFCNAFTIPQISEFKIKTMNVRTTR